MNPINESLNIIKKRKKIYYALLFLVFILLFLQYFFAGQHLYRTDPEKAEAFLDVIANTAKIKEIASLFLEGNYLLAGTFIFLNNFLIDVFSMYLGILPIVPIFILLSNALLTGMLFGIDSVMPPPPTVYSLFFLFIVGALEFSSAILATYEGIRIGMGWINPKIFNKKKRRDALKQNLKEGTKVLFLVMLLLITAAIIETIGIVLLGSKFIP